MNKFERIKKKIVNGSIAAVQTMKHLKETGEFSVSDEEYLERVAICEGDETHERCELYEKYAKDECGDCLCYIKSMKAGMAAMYCPLLKWPGDEYKVPEED